MKHKKSIKTKGFQLAFLMTAMIVLHSCGSKQKQVAGESESSLKKGVVLIDYREKKKVDVFIDGDLFTSYIYPSELEKPALFPIRSAAGTIITRGWPIRRRTSSPRRYRKVLPSFPNRLDLLRIRKTSAPSR